MYENEMCSISSKIMPWDLITDILTRLPPKSLLRFRCVSKAWRSYIDHPDFTDRHLSHSNSNLTLIFRDIHSHIFHLLHPLDHHQPQPQPNSHLSLPFELQTAIIGSCHGLLALHDSQGQIFIWNPCTRKHWILPVSASIRIGLCSVLFLLLGFGYDSFRKEYKLVRIAQLYSDYDDDFHTQVDIYTCGSDSWRRLNDGFPNYIRCSAMGGDYGVLANDALHWGVSGKFPLFAVGLRSEEHWEVEQPSYGEEEEEEEEGLGWGLGVLSGQLCVTRFDGGVGMVVWVMKEYGLKESWTRLVRMRFPDQDIGRCWLGLDYVLPLVYDKSGSGSSRNGHDEGVLLNLGGQELVWLEVEGKGVVNRVSRLQVANIPERFEAWTLVASLVAVHV